MNYAGYAKKYKLWNAAMSMQIWHEQFLNLFTRELGGLIMIRMCDGDAKCTFTMRNTLGR